MAIAIKILLLLFALINFISAIRTKDDLKKHHYFLTFDIYIVGLLISILICCK